ncbi:hypothetical protein HVTV-2_gp11 [Haloarcula virus HVTV-2]|uniref:Uncharacterized protein n=1 Tax=Haloarcula vallismortis tailed virus 1 TaxID=1262528 RepID=L7TJI4_9CAUD|nr:hypothetical protein HVTV1_11 [Haloarcula vallismortis tailed virus 1]AGC34543.1 hypothetical protein HVTV1_11 [Haloarcula vallismortis tailed virus 1]UBF22818.1 hypothetical protein HVTV-2_gp11 [Haloarcula virus HVTV-2]
MTSFQSASELGFYQVVWGIAIYVHYSEAVMDAAGSRTADRRWAKIALLHISARRVHVSSSEFALSSSLLS